jgi:type III secretion protein J
MNGSAAMVSMGSPGSLAWLRRLLRAAALLACVALAACGGRVDLLGAVPEDEANEVLAALLEAHITADKVPGKEGAVGVRVDGAQVGRALEVLRAKALPRERFDGMGKVFKKEGLISSPLEERARYIYALSQELSSTLSKMDGVLAARVHVVLPERGSAGESGVASSAAVFIKHQDGYNLEIVQPQIRRLVTNSIPGLTPERVSVIFVASQARPGAEAAPQPVLFGATLGADSGGMLGTLIVVLALVALAALAGLGWTVWRYVLPARRAAGRAPGRTAEGAA